VGPAGAIPPGDKAQLQFRHFRKLRNGAETAPFDIAMLLLDEPANYPRLPSALCVKGRKRLRRGHHGKFQRQGVKLRCPGLDASIKNNKEFLLVQDFLGQVVLRMLG
jgi:hypothetical protein